MKKVFFSAALLLGLTSISFADTPKGEAKDAKSETPTTSETGVTMKWYAVTYDAAHPNGYIPSGSTILVTGEQTDAESLRKCEEGTTFDCLRGFVSTPSLPSNSIGDGQVKTDDRP
nr:hypothetical protein [Pedobacter sp. ASV19]